MHPTTHWIFMRAGRDYQETVLPTASPNIVSDRRLSESSPVLTEQRAKVSLWLPSIWMSSSCKNVGNYLQEQPPANFECDVCLCSIPPTLKIWDNSSTE